jgi:hypothetical protein
MNVRTTTDPISLHEVDNPQQHPCIYEGDGENGIEIYFENEKNRQAYLDLDQELGVPKIVTGSDTPDYVAEG